MDKKEIIEILDLFSQKNFKKLTIKRKDFTLEVEKEAQNSNIIGVRKLDTDQKLIEAKESTGYKVKSPLVGVYYEAPSPESEPFVKLGDFVKKDEIICIIEAMKMINEIKAPVSGVVKKINFKNEELVQYDDVIMEIEEDV
ncbi:MAG: acetyl-CoA carboxylase, biotin carboxyl carrier protein [Tissierellia bacterium]|nr:acetyl-CoA carboxylase, biotin carboxyl carrier protein [Tissierellia bacterium]